jgi:hypothetical protein
MMVAFIDAYRDVYGVEPICEQLPIAPSTYYEHKAQERHPERCSLRAKCDDVLRGVILRIWVEEHQVYGVVKMWKQLKREGIFVARCTVARKKRSIVVRMSRSQWQESTNRASGEPGAVQIVPVPSETRLVSIHPNPFNPTTTVDFELKESAWTTISIYNVSGQLIRVETLGTEPVGRHNWVWKGTDQEGNSVSSGVYFIVLKAGTVTDRRKAVLLK